MDYTLGELQQARSMAQADGNQAAIAELDQLISRVPKPQPIKIGQDGAFDALKQTVGDANPMEAFLAGAGVSAARTGKAIKQMFGMDDSGPDNWGDLNKALKDQHGTAAFLGDAAGTAGQAYLAGRAMQGAGGMATAGGAARVGNVLNTAGRALYAPTGAKSAAAAGGVFTALTTPGDIQERALSGLFGAVGGGLGFTVGNAIANKAGQYLKGLSWRAASSASSAGGTATAQTGGQVGSGSLATGGGTASARGGGAGFGFLGPDVTNTLTPAQKILIEEGKRLGFRLTPGHSTGSKALQQLEAKLESQPMTSGPFNTLKENNQRVLNRLAARSIGEDASHLDSTVLGNAQERIGGVYESLANDSHVGIDSDSFLNKLANTEGEFEGLIGDGSKSIADHALVKRFIGYAANGGASSRQLTDLASKLGRAANSQMTSASGDRQLGMALFEVKNHVDDLLMSSMMPNQQEAFSAARQQYRNLMLLTKEAGTVNPANGNVSGASLANALRRADKNGYMFGKNQGDLYTAARIAQAFKPIVGDSGTATRSMVTNPMELMLSIPGGAASWLYMNGPTSATVNAAAKSRQLASGGAGLLSDGLMNALSNPVTPAVAGLLGTVEGGRQARARPR